METRPRLIRKEGEVERRGFSAGEEPRYEVVSEPDPRKIEKEGLVNRLGWMCSLRNVRNFISCLPSVAS